jgi:hypothetical protein
MNLQSLQESSLKRQSKKVSIKKAGLDNCCLIVKNIQDLDKQKICQKTNSKKIADEDYLKALKVHLDPRKVDSNVSFEVLHSVDRIVYDKLRPMSVEPNQRNSFENWVKYKTLQEKLRKIYLDKENSKEKSRKNLEENSEHSPIFFENWLKKKKSEEKRMKKEAFRVQNEEILNKLKLQQDGVSYKQWLKVSLAREKSEKRKRRAEETFQEEKKKEIEVQKNYEKHVKKLNEKKKRSERLSRLNFRKQEEQREASHSPLLLAYSPNKYSKPLNTKQMI